MTAAIQAGALSRVVVSWPTIDWDAAHRIVRRLQARIVKASQEKRWGKVRALQHLLTHSFNGKLLAVKQVTENSGKRTPGVDHIVWNTPAKKQAAVAREFVLTESWGGSRHSLPDRVFAGRIEPSSVSPGRLLSGPFSVQALAPR